MKKATIIIVITISLAFAVLLASCAAQPEGDRVYTLSAVETNDYDYTKDSFKQFKINLFEDTSYRVDFQAKGMPVVARENGTYTINNGILSLERAEDSSELIASIVSFDDKKGEIIALCKNKSDGKTFTATFSKSGVNNQEENIDNNNNDDPIIIGSGFDTFDEGIYTIIDVLENKNDYTVQTFLVFTLTFIEGEYTVAFRPAGAPMQFAEMGTYQIADGAMTLTQTGGLSFLVAALSYDDTLNKITLECKTMGCGENYTAIFQLEEQN